MSESDAVIVPLISDETRRIAAKLALSMYANEPCRICRRLLSAADLPTMVYAGWSRDGKARVVHLVCWENFVELLQMLPAQRLHELANEPREENNEGGQHDIPATGAGQ